MIFRELVTAEELAPLPAFERRIWGGDHDGVSAHMLVATIAEGGMAIGAFAGDDPAGEELVGVVYGFPTRQPDVLHSHYMAVDPAHRRAGLGTELKRRQRHWCLQRGITRVRWTFDPLQLGNAHLNLRVLGAVGEAYRVDHYGRLGGINGELPTDRLTVCWYLAGRPAVGTEQRAVDVPRCSAHDIAESAPAALAARLTVRAALEPALDQGWRVTDVDRDTRRYILTR